MKKIIVYTHLHNDIQAIADFSIQLARDLKKDLHFVQIVDTRSVSYSAGGIEPTVESGQIFNYDLLNKEKESLEENLNDIMNEQVKKIGANVKVDYQVAIDNPDWFLNEISKKEDTYLILLAESANESGLFGYENYKHLLNDLHCPILLVPDDITYHPLKQIVVTTDYQEEDVLILKKLEELANVYQSKILSLRVNEEEAFEYELKEKGFEQTLEEKVDYPKINFKAIEQEEAEEAISKFSEKIHADLLVLHKQQRNIFEKLFSKSRARKIIEKVHMPVLVYNDHTLSLSQ